MIVFKAEVPGRPPSKKNTKKVFKRHGHTVVVYSQAFKLWEKVALLCLAQAKVGKPKITKPLAAKFIFHFKNRHAEADVSNLIEAPQDALTKAQVISDDKIIHIVQGEKIFDGTEKTIIELFDISESI